MLFVYSISPTTSWTPALTDLCSANRTHLLCFLINTSPFIRQKSPSEKLQTESLILSRLTRSRKERRCVLVQSEYISSKITEAVELRDFCPTILTLVYHVQSILQRIDSKYATPETTCYRTIAKKTPGPIYTKNLTIIPEKVAILKVSPAADLH